MITEKSGKYNYLIILIYFILVCGEILNFFELKDLQYPIFAALSIIFFIRHTKILYTSLHVFYLLFFLLSFLIHIVKGSLELKTIFLASVYYLFIPAIFGSNNLSAKTVFKYSITFLLLTNRIKVTPNLARIGGMKPKGYLRWLKFLSKNVYLITNIYH